MKVFLFITFLFLLESYKPISADDKFCSSQSSQDCCCTVGKSSNVMNPKTNACPSLTFRLPRGNQVHDYVRYRAYFPRLTQATVCAWVENDGFDNHATVLSYAVPQNANELMLAFFNPTTVRFFRGGSLSDFPVPSLASLKKLHICVWFSRELMRTGVYINAEQVSTLGYNGAIIRGGGDLVLGQEQDSMNAGGLVAGESFSGNITNFMIWPRVLSGGEVHCLANNCRCPVDHVVATTLDRVELHGEAGYEIPDFCPSLNEL